MVHFFSSLKSSYNSDVTMTSVMLPAGSSAGKLDLRYGARHQRHLLVLGRKENSPFAHFLSIFSVFFEDQIDSFLQDGNIGKLKQFTRNNASWDASLHNIIGHNGCKSCVEHETKVNELRYLFVFNSLITRSFFIHLLRFLRTVRSSRIGFWSRVCSGVGGSGNLQWEILRKSVLKRFADIRLDKQR